MSVFDGSIDRVFVEWPDGMKMSHWLDDGDEYLRNLAEAGDGAHRAYVVTYNLVNAKVEHLGDFSEIDFDDWLDSFSDC